MELPAGWKFLRQQADPAAATDTWESVSIPHTWNAISTEQGKDYYRGEGWYVHTLDIPKEWHGKRVFVRFEGVSIAATPYINGKALDTHNGAFTAFCHELTPFLHFGAANELRVKVDNDGKSDVTPLSGDFNMSGGIYRPVHLIVTDDVCITPLDLASSGVYLTTKSLTDARADVEVKTLVSNGSRSDATVEVETEIKDAAGISVAIQKEDAKVAGGETLPVKSRLKISKPHRWGGRNDPYLYSATVRVRQDGKVIDEIRQPLGLRTVEITENEGFLLNGKPYPIHGVNRHQELKDKGWALSPADHEADAKTILDMGVTAVRNAHYPQSGYWHDLADRNGLLLWDELPIVNRVTDTPAFRENAELQLRELVTQLYNHPSVAFWGLFNELRSSDRYPDTLLYHLKAVIKEIDPSRLIVAATNANYESFNQIADHTTFNLYPGWYKREKGGPELLTPMVEAAASELGKRTAISEYGAGANPAQHQEGALTPPMTTGAFHPEEWQTHVHEALWKQIKGNPKLWGSFIWVMFDFSSAKRNEGGSASLNDKGLVSHDRNIKKDAYFFYKANWNPEPMVHIASRRMTPRTQAQTEVKVYSNTGPVELKVNGNSLGPVKPDDFFICRWENVPLAPGKNIIEATGRAGNKPLADQCEWLVTSAVEGNDKGGEGKAADDLRSTDNTAPDKSDGSK